MTSLEYDNEKEKFEQKHKDCVHDRERVITYCKNNKITRQRFAALAGIYEHVLYDWLNGRTDELQNKTRKKVLRVIET